MRPPNCAASSIQPNNARADLTTKALRHKDTKFKNWICVFVPLWLRLSSMQVYVNGESRELSGTPSLAELITQLDLPAARIAVELNREVVRRADWSSTMLKEDDRIEIVHFVGGGVDGYSNSECVE